MKRNLLKNLVRTQKEIKNIHTHECKRGERELPAAHTHTHTHTHTAGRGQAEREERERRDEREERERAVCV